MPASQPHEEDSLRLSAVTLEQGLRQLALPHDPARVKRILEYGGLLLAANEVTNLSGTKTLQEFITRHILDSLAPLARLPLLDPVMDLGSGGGLPGVPAAIVYPEHQFILLEPRRKRAAFLQAALAELDVRNAHAVRMSAGAATRGGYYERTGTVLMRAVAKPAAAISLGLPLVRPGGMLLLYEGRASQPSRRASAMARRFGGALTVWPVSVPFLDEQRHVWVVRKPAPSSSNRKSATSERQRFT